MTGPSWLIDGKRIATKIKYASESKDPNRVNWISNPTKPCPSCNHIIDNDDVVQDWPGLPEGVKFDPSDQELITHLIAKLEKGDERPHPFINEFIPTVDEDDGICYTHPKKLPGVKLDGSVSHFFHRTFKAYNSGTRKRRKIQHNGADDVRWHKTGKTKPVIVDGKHVGCKKIMVLYSSLRNGEKPQKTNWVMHQYHLGTGEDETDGEFVVSKLFYQQQPMLKSCSNANKFEVVEEASPVMETMDNDALPVPPSLDISHAFSVHDKSAMVAVCSPLDNDQNCVQESVTTDSGTIINDSTSDKILKQGNIADQDNENGTEATEDPKWWEGESQFLLDSQQLAEGIALCDEFLHSQSQTSCGGEIEEATKRIKPCALSEYAKKGGVDVFKKDLEECQILNGDHFATDDSQPQLPNFELMDTPPDFRLSQLEF